MPPETAPSSHRIARRLPALALALFAAASALHASALAQAPTRLPSTESSIGVWYQAGAPASGDLWRAGDVGERLFLRGRVLTVSGRPVSGALVEIWHADGTGEVHEDRFRAALTTPADGAFAVKTVLPGYIWGPRHIHVMVTHPAHPRFITRVFFKRDPEVASSDQPELAIHLEEGRVEEEPALFGGIELILAPG